MLWPDIRLYTKEGLDSYYSVELEQLSAKESIFNEYKKHVDTIKKNNFQYLYEYEKKRNIDPTITPNNFVLQDLKKIERDPIYMDLKQQIIAIENELTARNSIINKHYSYLANLFTFDAVSIKNYCIKLKCYFANECTIDSVMEYIFLKEFGDSKLFYKVNAHRQYAFFDLLIEKAPLKYKVLFTKLKKILIAQNKKDMIIYMRKTGNRHYIKYHRHLMYELSMLFKES